MGARASDRDDDDDARDDDVVDDDDVSARDDVGEDSDEDFDEGEEGSGEDEDFEPRRGRRRAGREPATGVSGGGGDGDDEGAPAVPASEFSIDADRARFKPGTLKHEVFKMLEEAWPTMLDANELYTMGTMAGVNVGKNKTVLASGMSHDVCFVRVPGTRNKWALRAHVGYPAGKKRPAEDDKGPREKRARSSRPRDDLTALLETVDADAKATLIAWSEKLKQNVADLKKAKIAEDKAKTALEKAQKALDEFESNPQPDCGPVQTSTTKSTEDILCEPEAPSDRLAKEFVEYTGPNDRKFLVAWKKSVETEKERIKAAQDAYVAKRKKEMREASTKLNKKRDMLVSALSKAQTALSLATGTIERAEFVTDATRERIELLKEKATATDDDAKKAVDEKITKLDEKVTELFGQKLAALESQIEREKLKLISKGARDAERARLMEEKSRLKDEEKQERARQREIEKAEKEKAKAEERAAKEKAARYPLDDDILALELAEEAKQAGVPLETLLRPIPPPVAVPNGQVIAEEAFVAEFVSVFGTGLQCPEGLTNVEGVSAALENNQKSRSTLAELYMSILYEALSPTASGPGRFVARLNRIVNNLNWPEVARMLILHGGENAHGSAAVAVAKKMANTTWDQLANAEHLILLRALADLALEGDICRNIIADRISQADVFRSERHEARLKAVANRRIVEKAEKEERRRERERVAEEKKAAKAVADASKVQGFAQDMEHDLTMETAEDATMEDASQEKHEQTVVDAIERRKQELIEEEARRKLELEEKRSRDREQKRAAEDAACQVRARPLGMDRHFATYWWNFGGRKDGIYVQSFAGEWGIYNSQQAVDALVNALCDKGVRESALKKQLEKRKVTIADCFKAMTETQEERDARLAAELAGGERRSARSRTAPSSDLYIATRPAAYLSCDEGSVLTAARKCMDTMCINAERIGFETDVDWRTFRNKLKNAPTSYIAEQLLHLEQLYFDCQVEEFKIAAEREKIEREKQPEAPDELSKATLELLVLKHTGKDMSSWKLARRKLAALLPAEVLAEALEERRRQQVDSDEEESDEDEDQEVDESWNNDENAPEDFGDITIWKGTLQRPNFISYLNPKEDYPVVRIAYAAATLLDATCAFTEEIVHRREVRAKNAAK